MRFWHTKYIFLFSNHIIMVLNGIKINSFMFIGNNIS